MIKLRVATRVGLLLFGLGLGIGSGAQGQSIATATQTLELSAFGAGTGTYIGFEDGRNAAFTAGVDLSIPPFFGVRPAIEVRGTLPIDKGSVIGEKSILFGPRFMKTYGRFHPYIDGMYGRGEMTYIGGFVVGTFRYDRTTTNIFAGGGGVDIRLTDHFDVKADVQYQHWGTPVDPSGAIYSTPLSLGIVYHLDFNRLGHHAKLPKYRPEVSGPMAPPPPEAGQAAPMADPAPTPATDPAPVPSAPATTPAPAATPDQRTGTSTPPAGPQ